MSIDTLTVELEVLDGKAEVVIGKNRRLLNDFVADVNKAQPKLRFSVAGESYIDLDKLEKRAFETRKKFEEVAKVRLNGGQIGLLTQDIVKTSERARQLQSDIAGIKKELLSPNRKTSIAFLTDELKAAEREADRLNRKLNSLPSGSPDGRRLDGSTRRGSADLKLSSFQKQNLSYQINDVLTGLASGQNPTQILAQQGGQIAQIFNPQQITAFTAAYGSLVTVLGAGAAAIALTYKITGDLRAEAERRLKVEDDITKAVNKQIFAAKELAREFAEQRANAARADNFSQFVKTDSIEDLTTRKKSLEAIVNLTRNAEATGGKTDDSKALINAAVNARRELLAVEQRIREVSRDKTKAASDNFNQSFINSEKSRQDAIESQNRFNEKLKKFNEEIEKGKKKVEELGKVYKSTFAELYSKQNAANPFVAVFSEADKALTDLRKNLAGLSPELQAQAVALQTKINSNALFSTKLDNALSTFNLRDDAANFRNFKPAFDPSQADEIARRNVSYGGYTPGGTFGSDLANKAGGFDKLTEKQKRDIYQVSLLSQPSFNTDSPSTFNALNQKSLVSKLASEQLALANPDENKSFQEKLQKELDIVNKFKLGAATQEQVDAANRKIVSLTSVDPSKLDDRERSQAAVAREALADRQDKYQQEAMALDKEKLKSEKELTAEIKKLREIAEKEGIKGLETFITIKDETGAGVGIEKKSLKKAPTTADTARAYSEYQNHL